MIVMALVFIGIIACLFIMHSCCRLLLPKEWGKFIWPVFGFISGACAVVFELTQGDPLIVTGIWLMAGGELLAIFVIRRLPPGFAKTEWKYWWELFFGLVGIMAISFGIALWVIYVPVQVKGGPDQILLLALCVFALGYMTMYFLPHVAWFFRMLRHHEDGREREGGGHG